MIPPNKESDHAINISFLTCAVPYVPQLFSGFLR